MRRLARYAAAYLWCAWILACFTWGGRLARGWPVWLRSNCFLWAMGQYVRHGGRLVMVSSQWGPWLHAYWIRPDGRAFEFNPTEPKRRRRVPPALFEGHVQERIP
jgi:hypothetical protein